MDLFSKRESMKKYLDWDEDDLLENESTRLLEMGVPEKESKQFPPHVRMNLIYGDGEIGRAWIEEKSTEEEPTLPRNLSPDDMANVDTEAPIEEEPAPPPPPSN